ncbi:MAG TPA: FAD binding domain-containing protein, partial [Caldimonas sp.]
MKPAAFEYQRAASIAEALSAMRDPALSAKPLAGGQSLGPMLNLRLARPARLVDISGIEELRRIDDCGAFVRFGAAVTHARIEDEASAFAGVEPLARAARGIAYRAVRNRGTIGGSLAHADPAADWPLVLAALGATIVVQGERGPRRIDAAAFMLGSYVTQLGEDELLTAVEVPKLSAGARWAYRKFCRKAGEFAQAAAAVLLDPERRVARVFIGAPADRPTSLPALAGELARRGRAALDGDRVPDLLRSVLADADPARRQAGTIMLARAI